MLTFKLHQQKGSAALYPAPLRACDQCRRKRMKCDRGEPCCCCARAGSACTYAAVPKARGRRPRIPSRAEMPLSPDSIDACGVSLGTWVPTKEHNDEMPSPRQLERPVDSAASHDSWTALQLGNSVDGQSLPLNLATTPDWLNNIGSPQASSNAEAPPGDDGFIGNPQTTRSVAEPPFGQDAFAVATPASPSEPCGSIPGARAASRLPLSRFTPYVDLFLERLYPVFPVVDKAGLMGLLRSVDGQSAPQPAGFYSFLAALSAAVIVQLNAADPHASQPLIPDRVESDVSQLPVLSAQFFVSQCLQMRQEEGFIEDANEWTILASFFLFAYYGNFNQSRLAWYYLREAIGFAQALGLDDVVSCVGLSLEELQRRRRLFWLLFITERAYSLQHRRKAVLRPSIDLPRVFDSECPKLIYGFVTLVKVFSAVDDTFITSWVSQQDPVHAGSPPPIPTQSLSEIMEHGRAAGTAVSPSEIDEIQRLDILVTQQWLRVLSCQAHLRRELQCLSRISHQSNHGYAAQCVIDNSKSLLHTISTGSRRSLEAHGIGMEQKVSDVASCLCDVLRSADINALSTDFFSTSDILHNIMVFLTGFRNHESQYLQPLAQKATVALAANICPQPFPEMGKKMMDSTDLTSIAVRGETVNRDRERCEPTEEYGDLPR